MKFKEIKNFEDFKFWFEHYALPNWLDSIYRDWSHFYWNHIRCHIVPQNKWATKSAIPKTWKDKSNIIPDILFECIIHFVEGEKCFETTDWENNKEIADQIKDIYNYIKYRRPTLEKQMFSSSPINKDFTFDKYCNGEYSFDEYNKYSELIDAQDTEYLLQIVKIRQYLWT